MSEKRFVLYSDEYFFGAYDKIAQEKIDVLGSIYLLNSLSEENDRLSERLIEKRDKLETEYVILKKENEQLKKRVDKLKVIIAEFGATLLMNGFDIEVDGKDLMEMINNE